MASGTGREPMPWSRLRRPLAESRLALIAVSVCFTRGRGRQPGVTTGKPEWRQVPADVDTRSLWRPSAGAADPGSANLDRNLAMGLDRLRDAVGDGRLGELAPRHLGLGGPMAASRRAVGRAAAAAAVTLLADRADAALLIPT